MKQKYYLRGLGTGIVVTALIMSFITKPEKLTDAQIKLRAAQLGMVEENTLADLKEEIETEEAIVEGESVDEDTSMEKEMTEETGESESVENETLEDVSAENIKEDASEETNENDSSVNVSGEKEEHIDEIAGNNEIPVSAETEVTAEEKNDNGKIEMEAVENYIVITVEKGNGSNTVSQKLFEAGLINSAVEYDQYLITNGYDRKLRAGNHEIPVDANEEEIAKILCRMQ